MKYTKYTCVCCCVVAVNLHTPVTITKTNHLFHTLKFNNNINFKKSLMSCIVTKDTGKIVFFVVVSSGQK